MEQTSYRTWNLRWLLGGFATGILIAVIMPDDWHNLAFMPWYVTWFVEPSALLFVTICLAFRIDWISDNANIPLVTTIWTLAVATIFAIYGLVLGFIVRWLRGRENLPE